MTTLEDESKQETAAGPDLAGPHRGHKANGNPAEKRFAFRKTFGELETRIKLFVLVFEKEAIKRPAA